MTCKKAAKGKKLNPANILSLLEEQRTLLAKKQPSPFPITPYQGQSYLSSEREIGEKLLKAGEIGCLLVAGGQGTRAKFPHAKGLFPISNIKNKSFFQLFAEKTAAASNFAGRPLHLAIMTSPLNDHEIRTFWESNNYFGLAKEQVDFFSQGMLPFLDDEGNTFFSSKDHIAMGPNGNGGALKEFVSSGIWDKWQQKGIKYLNFVMIDNPLADPFDMSLLDFHVRRNAELTLKCIERDNPEEKVGILVKSNEHIKVVEYSEAPEEVFKDKTSYPLANISLFIINMETIFAISKEALPLHLAHKPVLRYNPISEASQTVFAWKFEYFIFDILNFVKKIEVLVYPKALAFSPLKNHSDIERVKLALLELDKRTFSALTETDLPTSLFELDQQFYYPTKDLKKKWRGQKPPLESYIYP